ncbi:RhuM family protein [Dyella sp. M7H15-1]|uniref:RhuM family protein n=1 Tax=Dyella sp. M7H15-1 TaxID=2501295 RepID=UPI0031B6AF01
MRRTAASHPRYPRLRETLYQELRDLFKASSSDYDGSAQTAKTFFATIQNKLVFAVTGQTAAAWKKRRWRNKRPPKILRATFTKVRCKRTRKTPRAAPVNTSPHAR